MKKSIALLCALIIAISLSVTVFSAEKAEPKAETTTTTGSLIGGVLGSLVDGSNASGIKDKVSGVADGLLDKLSGLGGLIDGIGKDDTTAVTYNIYTINPVVTAAPQQTAAATVGQTVSTSSESQGETVDYAATVNPYTKPTETLKPGDKGDGVKWLQWAFIYSHYGLADNGITGVYDEQTEAVVKKLQLENSLTVDGIANDDIINKAEVLYIQYRDNLTSTAAASESVTETVPTTAETEKKDSNSKVVLIIVAIAIVWALVIAVVVFLFIAKKKKDKKDIAKLDSGVTASSEKSDANTSDASDTNAPSKTQTTETSTEEKKENDDKSFSLSDLFEEAEKNSKK